MSEQFKPDLGHLRLPELTGIEMLTMIGLLHRPAYGQELASRVYQMTHGELLLIPGTLYPGLRRLVERKALEHATAQMVEGRRRGARPTKNYSVTDEGRQLVKSEIECLEAFIRHGKHALGLDPYAPLDQA